MYETVITAERLAWWGEKLHQAHTFAIDTETTSTDPMSADLVGVALALDDENGRHCCYIPVAHTDGPNMPWGQVRDAIEPACNEPGIVKVLHNAVYDLVVFARHGMDMTNIDDTMLMSYELTKRQNGHGMDELAEKYLDRRTIKFDEVFRPPLGMLTFADVPVGNATEYSAEDVDVTLDLWRHFRYGDFDLSVYDKIDRPLIEPMARMKLNGIAVSKQRMAKLSVEWQAIIDENTAKFAEVAPGVSLGSNKQLGQYIYDTLKMPVLKTTDSGAPSVDGETLELMEDDHPALKFVAVAKKYGKLVGTYTDAIPKLISPATGRLHTHIGMTSTHTARFSSSDPNLQNIPSPSNEKNAAQGKAIREAFVAPRGHRIVSADYSQIELRVLAQATGDETLINAFNTGIDIHEATAATVFGKRWELADAAERKILRRFAKTINFGLIYGMTSFGLAKQLKIDEDTAQEFIDTYFSKMTGVMKWSEKQKIRGGATREVTTLFGRKLYLPQGNFGGMRSYAERCAMNYPIQGSAADVIRLAIPRVDTALRTAGLYAPMLLQVHDELLFECREEIADDVCAVVKKSMETACDGLIQWKIPIIADAQHGANWADAH